MSGPVDGRPHRLAAGRELQRAGVPVARGVDPFQRQRVAVLAQQVDLVPGRVPAPRPAPRCRRWSRSRRAGTRGRSARARPATLRGWPSRAAAKVPPRCQERRTGCVPRRPAARSSCEAEPGRVYRDRETGEELEIVGKLLPLPPSRSRLPGPWRRSGSATGATSPPSATSTTARPAAAGCRRCRASWRSERRARAAPHRDHRRRAAGAGRCRLRQRRDAGARGAGPAGRRRAPGVDRGAGRGRGRRLGRPGLARPTRTPRPTTRRRPTTAGPPATRAPRRPTPAAAEPPRRTPKPTARRTTRRRPTDSDAEQFEDFCAQNPGAC